MLQAKKKTLSLLWVASKSYFQAPDCSRDDRVCACEKDGDPKHSRVCIFLTFHYMLLFIYVGYSYHLLWNRADLFW